MTDISSVEEVELTTLIPHFSSDDDVTFGFRTLSSIWKNNNGRLSDTQYLLLYYRQIPLQLRDLRFL
jgi:hypothetical protein